MARLNVMGNDRLGPVAEESTRERCIALYPGSSPGRVSSLRSLRELRLGKPVHTDSAGILSHSVSREKAGLPRRSSLERRRENHG
jgi:hypothetical protein